MSDKVDLLHSVALVPQSQPILRDDNAEARFDCFSSKVSSFITSIYEQYATLYPSTALLNEYQQRDSLIRAIAASDQAQNHQRQLELSKKEKLAAGGFLRRLFGKYRTNTVDSINQQTPSQGLENRLIYSESIDTTFLSLTDYTSSSIDTSAIPPEAHAAVRFHLSSSHRPHVVVRTKPEQDVSRSLWIIVGLGQLIELPSRNTGTAAFDATTISHQSPVHCTSDYDDLVTADSSSFRLEYTRAAMISPTILIVSWGFINDRTNVVIYRRIAQSVNDDSKTKNFVVSWQTFAWIGPSAAYRKLSVENDDDYTFLEAAQNDNFDGTSSFSGLQMQNITDVVPMAVHYPPSNASNLPTSAIIAISRLGGYVEFIALPPTLCCLPLLERAPPKKKRKMSSIKNNSYLVEVPNLAKSIPSSCMCAISTAEYHNDVIGLESFCLRSLSNPKMHNQGADYVILAHGGRIDKENMYETLSFWSIHIEFDPNASEVGFLFRVEIAEALDLTGGSNTNSHLLLGPVYTTMATPTILQHWRTPRNVELKKTMTATDELLKLDEELYSKLENQQTKSCNRVTTISVPVPISTVRFFSLNLDGENSASSSTFVRLVLLDANGGSTVLNCDLLARYLTDTLSDADKSQRDNDTNETDFSTVPLVQIVYNRSDMLQLWSYNSSVNGSNSDRKRKRGNIIRSTSGVLRIRDIHWLTMNDSPSKSSDLSLAALIQNEEGAGTHLRILIDNFGIQKSRGTFSQNQTIVYRVNQSVIPGICTGCFHRFTNNDELYLSLETSIQLPKDSNATMTLSSKETKNDSVLLQLYTIQAINPQDLIQSLFHSKKYSEVVAIYHKRLRTMNIKTNTELSNVLEACKKKVWEQELDLEVLETILDDAYVIDQVLLLFNTTEYHDQYTFHDIVQQNEILKFRSICELAINRASKNSFYDNSIQRIRNCIVRLGSYLILCEYFLTNPNLGNFIQEFLNLNISNLAISLAKQGLLVPLSVLYFRHEQETFGNLDILNAIPLSLPPRKYAHLLPIKKYSQNQRLFLIGSKEQGTDSLAFNTIDFVNFPMYFRRRFETDVVIDENDQLYISLHQETNVNSVIGGDTCMLEDWYNYRLKLMFDFVNSVNYCYDFAKLAIRALHPQEPFNILTTVRLNDFFREMYLGEKMTNKLTILEVLSTMTIDKLNEQNVTDIVDCIFKNTADCIDFEKRLTRLFLPLMKLKTLISLGAAIEKEASVAIVSYCMDLTMKLVSRPDEFEFQKRLENVLEICWIVAYKSRSNLEKSERLIKNILDNIKFVLYVIETIQEACFNSVDRTIDNCLLYIEYLWKLYETLPSTVVPTNDAESIDEINSLQSRMDNTFRELIKLDITSRYPCNAGRIPVICMNWRFLRGEDFVLQPENVIVCLCDSFCFQVGHSQKPMLPNVDVDKSVLLKSLLSDINEIIQLTDSSFSLKSILLDQLVKPLLRMKQIKLIGEFLSNASFDAYDLESVSEEVVLFLNDYLNESISSLQGVDYKNLFCHLPQVQEHFQSIQNLIKAAHFINTVLFEVEKPKHVRPADLSDLHSLDVIDLVLDKNPTVLLKDWEDSSSASKANGIIRSRFNSNSTKRIAMNPTEQDAIPEVPGHYILQLAQIVGVRSIRSMIYLKTRLCMFFISKHCFGAAAAVCRSLLADISEARISFGNVLSVCARIVSSVEYEDVETKRELCKYILSQKSTNIEVNNLRYYNEILKMSNSLENERQLKTSRTKSPFGTVGKLFSDTKAEYNLVLEDLYVTCQLQSSSCVMDDKLLDTLFKYCVYWCIARTTRPLTTPVGEIDKYETKSIFFLAAGLILSFRNKKQSKETFLQVQNVFLNEKNKALQNYPPTDIVIPNIDIVRRIVGRGYSEICAQKAAAKTNNAGFNEALQWAVMHSLDHDIDSPVIHIRRPGRRFIDYDTIDSLSQAFAIIDDFQNSSRTLASFLSIPSLNESTRYNNQYHSVQAIKNRMVTSVLNEKEKGTVEDSSNSTQKDQSSLLNKKAEGNKAGASSSTETETSRDNETTPNLPTIDDEDENNDIIVDVDQSKQNTVLVVDYATTTTISKQKVVMLISNLALNRKVTALQERAYTILKAHSVEFETLDAADPNLREIRDELVGKSGLRGQYPQFFLVDVNSGEATFWGDWDRLEQANDDGVLAKELCGTAPVVSPSHEPQKIVDITQPDHRQSDNKNTTLTKTSTKYTQQTSTQYRDELPQSLEDVRDNATQQSTTITDSFSLVKHPPPASSLSSKRPPCLALDSPDRSALLKAGQKAFDRLRKTPTAGSPSAEERLRLIEEGRRLIERQRGTPLRSPPSSTSFTITGPPSTSRGNINPTSPTNDANGISSAPIAPSVSAIDGECSNVETLETQADGSGWDFDENDNLSL